MKKTFVILALTAVMVMGGVAGWNILCPSGKWRYKITVNLETPEGLKTGSAVREVTVQQTPKLTPEMGPTITQRGEAVVIDLGKRGVAFAVMGTNDYWIFFQAFPPPKGPGNATQREGMRYYASLKDRNTILPLHLWPLIVAFKDINDPQTIGPAYHVVGKGVLGTRNYTFKVEDNFEKLFGKGVRLKDITVKTTKEPVSWGIEKYLGWLPARKNMPGAIGGDPRKPFEDPTGLFLTGGNFSQGRYW